MNVTIREIIDIDTLMHWRREVIRTVFGEEPTPALLENNRRYYQTHLRQGKHIAVIAGADGIDAGCGAICLSEELPSPDNPSGRCAYLMNIYVREEFRGHGVGHSIVLWLVKKASEMGCDKVYLETTDTAHSLYKGIGFKELPGMMKYADIHDN